MSPLKRLRAWWMSYADPWPEAIPLPEHVRAVRLDPKLLLLHMEAAKYPSAHVGYIKPSKE